MSEYLIIIVIMLVIYFVLVRNKKRPKTDWENLPILSEYLKDKKAINEEKKTLCLYCGSDQIINKPLKDKKENPAHTKSYHTCSHCRVILWRSEV